MITTATPDDLGIASPDEDVLIRRQALRLARTLDLDEGAIAGGFLPMHWIWVYFAPLGPTAALRADGHPAVPADSPLAHLERRMFIGGSLNLHTAMKIDSPMERVTRIVSLEAKEGRTGEFVVVHLEHTYTQEGQLTLVERQDILYRSESEAAPVAAVGEPTDLPASTGARRGVDPDERLLFRYSALTFNAHRIHYDLAYAKHVEGYPGLVVHGPLTATLLAELATQELGLPLATFSFRATAPTFAGVRLWLTCSGTSEGGALQLDAKREDGIVVMTATAGSRP